MKRTPCWWMALFVYGIAMGALEGIVVVYLRELYYPGGFAFPMRAMPERVYLAELAREAATLFMLGGLAALSARGFWRQFAVFLWSFAIWDIAYYITLKIALDWPSSLLTWDILFLIPIPWVGPVLAPVLYCVAMWTVGEATWRLADAGIAPRGSDLALIALSVVGAFYAFMEEPFRVIMNAVAGEPDRAQHARLAAEAFQQYVPTHFAWPIFLAAWAIGLAAAFRMLARTLPQMREG